jgi:hypothetical protein
MLNDSDRQHIKDLRTIEEIYRDKSVMEMVVNQPAIMVMATRRALQSALDLLGRLAAAPRPVMTNAEAVAKLKSLGVDRADEVLCDLLGSLGYEDVVEAYGRLFDDDDDDDKEDTE